MVECRMRWTPWVAAVSVCLSAGVSEAQVFQTDAAMTPLPVPVGMAEWTLVTDSWAYRRDTQVNRDLDGNDVNQQMLTFGDFYPDFEDGDAITLSGLFKWRGEMIDEVRDARTAPGHFSPRCGFTGELVLLGGNCDVAFGWYNVTDPNSTTPPAPNEIFELIPADRAYLDCQPPLRDTGFCPLAWDNVNPRELDKKLWQPMAFGSGSIADNPNYLGGDVGFVVIGSTTNSCIENKYSLMGMNQKNANGEPWVTALIYQSTVDPEGFYLAFEDLPMSAEDWKQTGVPGNMGTNDGDFNDFVFYISGLGCEGGGEACDTGLLGACSLGRTDCAAEGQTGMCRPIIQPGNETCDNVDNDCDGVVDNGEGLCPANQVCDKGSCVAPCGGGEFNCPAGLVCNSERICIDEACADVTCEPGLACRGGVCVSPCDGVTCPSGQECQLGRCVDPCAGIDCPEGRVCERGLCLSDCSCRGCDAGLTCAADGRCTDPACDGVVCDAGLVCELGTCVDPCEGVVCPGGGMCIGGNCTDPLPNATASSSTGSGGTGIIVTTDGIIPGNAASTASGAGGAGNGSSGGVAQRGSGEASGCGCRLGEQQQGKLSSALILLGAVAGGALRRRRRQRATPAR